MKTRFLIIPAFIAALILGGCASSGYITDDVYYIPQGEASVQAGTAVRTNTETTARQPAEATGDEVFSAINDSFRDNTYNNDTLQLTPQEAAANQGGNVVINNYDDSYAARINHFFYPSAGLSYYDPFYYGGAGYYDPFYSPGLSLSMGLGFGYGFGYGYGYGYGMPYYNPWYSPYSLYSPYSPYSYYPYYGGTGIYQMPYSPDYGENNNPQYGHRENWASNRLSTSGSSSPSATTSKSSIIPSDSRRVSGTRTRTSNTVSTAQPRTATSTATMRNAGTRVPVSTAKRGTTHATTFQPRRATQTGSHVRTTRLPQQATTRNNINEHRSVGNTSRRGRTYVPRYTNIRSGRTTARPTYNPSHNVGTSRSRSVTSSPVIRRSYSPAVKRGSSTYAPRRSYSPSPSYHRSSTPSVSAPRSTSSSSRSSGRGGRRR